MNRRHVRHGCLIALATACAWLGGERQLRAQSEADSWPLPYPNLRAVAEMTAASAADDVAFTLQGLQTPTPAPTPAPAPNHFAGRACDGCPWRRPGTALLQATYINVFYGLANLVTPLAALAFCRLAARHRVPLILPLVACATLSLAGGFLKLDLVQCLASGSVKYFQRYGLDTARMLFPLAVFVVHSMLRLTAAHLRAGAPSSL